MLITIQIWKEFVDERRPEEAEQSWETCSRAIREYDNHMVRNWKEEIDTLLVFVRFPPLTPDLKAQLLIIDPQRWSLSPTNGSGKTLLKSPFNSFPRLRGS